MEVIKPIFSVSKNKSAKNLLFKTLSNEFTSSFVFLDKHFSFILLN